MPIAPARIATCEVAARLTVQMPADAGRIERKELGWQEVAGHEDRARGQRHRCGLGGSRESLEQLQFEVAQVVGPCREMPVVERSEPPTASSIAARQAKPALLPWAICR